MNLFRAITFNITDTSLPRVDITFRILPRICTVLQSVQLPLTQHINEKNTNKCTLYLHSNVLNRSRRRDQKTQRDICVLRFL